MSTFLLRKSSQPQSHGCAHVMALKGASEHIVEGSPAAVAAQRIAAELIDAYRTCVRYSLTWENRAAFSAYLKKLQLTANDAAKKRKTASVLHRELQAISKVIPLSSHVIPFNQLYLLLHTLVIMF
jgi:hypothetical protein